MSTGTFFLFSTIAIAVGMITGILLLSAVLKYGPPLILALT